MVFHYKKVGIYDNLLYTNTNNVLNLVHKNLSSIVKYVLITPWCPVSRLEWYEVIILSVLTSGMGNTIDSLSGFDTILNNNKSNSIFFC